MLLVSALAGVLTPSLYDVVSTDVFDTVLWRDSTTQLGRLAMACRRAAPRLGVDPVVLTRLRWDVQDSAYRAVAIECPAGDVSLSAICRTVATALGMDGRAARVLQEVEVLLELEHLSANRRLLTQLGLAARAGLRVIALSDTYYSAADLWHMLDAVVGPHPISGVYSSGDLGLTKHGGEVFNKVAEHEGVPGPRIIHLGDNVRSDVQMARAASWAAVHVPRDGLHRAAKLAGKIWALPMKVERSR